MGLLLRIRPFAVIFFAVEFLLRLSLLARAIIPAEIRPGEIVQIFLRGLWLDTVTFSFFLLPIAMYHVLLPTRLHGSLLDRRLDILFRLCFIFLLLFDAGAEHAFWTEFATRFNFIAVDYLVYTQEVVGNIWESYPIVPIMLAVSVLCGLLTWISCKYLPFRPSVAALSRRLLAGGCVAVLCATGYFAGNIEQYQFGDNAEAQELAANGIYNLFYAYLHNEIDYQRFYATLPEPEVTLNAERLLDDEHSQRINDTTRLLRSSGAELHKNVVIVVMESMSADFMGAFGNTQNLTPNLDRIAKEGLFFTEMYATGTRTVRGLEAVTLSIPPTPGQSLVRRPGNENLFSLGFIFRDRGYDTKFLYGGYGYFDNMNAFFGGNGFDVIDRTALEKNEIEFANVWGVCDEDMFKKLISEADASYAAHRPFMHLLMTTSNHRPYTYPDGRIDIPSHENRYGGVKYADYSVGKLLEWAEKKPWFKDTVFVFVADHTAGAGGKAELDPRKYHIPMIIYSPGFIKPQRFENIASQIDLAPILLGQLRFTYYSRFYGEDLMHDDDEVPHAFISNFQKVALVREGKMSVLSPKQGVANYSWPQAEREQSEDEQLTEDAITYYQSASWWRDNYRRIPTVVNAGKQ